MGSSSTYRYSSSKTNSRYTLPKGWLYDSGNFSNFLRKKTHLPFYFYQDWNVLFSKSIIKSLLKINNLLLFQNDVKFELNFYFENSRFTRPRPDPVLHELALSVRRFNQIQWLSLVLRSTTKSTLCWSFCFILICSFTVKFISFSEFPEPSKESDFIVVPSDVSFTEIEINISGKNSNYLEVLVFTKIQTKRYQTKIFNDILERFGKSIE